MAYILSIQSHVCYGYVGNRVATFTLQRLKHDVITINTVQFSNHTGYGQWQGDIFDVSHLEAIWQGIKERIDLSQIDGLLTGYLGNQKVASLVASIADEISAKNDKFSYCLDPVFGDVGRDIFVEEKLAQFFKNQYIFKGDMITPNHFEMNYICEQKITNLSDLAKAAKTLLDKGIKKILVTSYQGEECQDEEISMVLLSNEDRYFIKTPKLDFDIAPNGSGDLVSALVMDLSLKGLSHKALLEQVTTKVFQVFIKTKKANTRELQLIQAQDDLVDDSVLFQAVPF